MHVQNCCFAYSTYCFYDVLVVVAVEVGTLRNHDGDGDGDGNGNVKKQ